MGAGSENNHKFHISKWCWVCCLAVREVVLILEISDLTMNLKFRPDSFYVIFGELVGGLGRLAILSLLSVLFLPFASKTKSGTSNQLFVLKVYYTSINQKPKSTPVITRELSKEKKLF